MKEILLIKKRKSEDKITLKRFSELRLKYNAMKIEKNIPHNIP